MLREVEEVSGSGEGGKPSFEGHDIAEGAAQGNGALSCHNDGVPITSSKWREGYLASGVQNHASDCEIDSSWADLPGSLSSRPASSSAARMREDAAE